MNPIYAQVLYEYANPGQTRRRSLIARLERMTGRRQFLYITPLDAPGAFVSATDVPAVVTALQSLPLGAPLDLVLNTPGGSPDAADQIMRLLRRSHPQVRVVVPNAAKSAGTLMALAADSVVMGPPSQLGPIDPQVLYPPLGLYVPAHAVVDSYRQFVDAVNLKGRLEPADYLMAQRFDQALINVCEKAIADAESLAESWLTRYMLKDQPTRARETARILARNRQSHSMAIGIDEARELALTVEALDDSSRLWRLYWELFLHAETFLRKSGHIKLFETRTTTLALRSELPQPHAAAPPTAPANPHGAESAPAGYGEE
ncbi:conserved protein of unknown function [Candidatus Hydrogenisulfobacillus filiaventi]|uniref:Serine dehydrogenase proteinase n=1 Tax=Candidatus Hydrogenisulfobacillus filiaventi TaxID=2707344 RepID=A0A6F8ZIG2_9FIRM|nr:ATP-dependent Clp protease proteolytic subunit [Bacillota bacterium]CAB1129732.1 conserved protein of unknown function [Candidatus Hydrogenisulfobacillus filiaventi]